MKNKINLLLLSIFVASCTTLSLDDCKTQNWQEFAKERTQKRPDSFTKLSQVAADACKEHQVSPNLSALKQGYNDGLKQYCRPKNIWDEALAGKKANLFYCSSDERPKLQRVYNAASQLHEVELLELKLSQQRGKISNLYAQVSELESQLSSQYSRNATAAEIESTKSAISAGRSQILTQENEAASTQLEIHQLRRRLMTFNQVLKLN